MVKGKKQGSARPSRTRKKQIALQRQRLGERLVALPPEQVAAVPMPTELAEAVAEARHMQKHGARRRQLQYIGALMRELDPDPIQAALDQMAQGDRQEVRQFKRVEAWRDALLAGERQVLTDIGAFCPQADPDRIMQLVAETHACKAVGAKRKAARRLFRYLKGVATTP